MRCFVNSALVVLKDLLRFSQEAFKTSSAGRPEAEVGELNGVADNAATTALL